DFLKEDAVRQLVAAVVDPATRDFNFEVRRGNEIDAGTLASLLDTPPMMAERRMVIVRDVGALKKDARAALDRYLGRPSADTVLVLLTIGDGKADKKLESAAGLSVCFDPLTDDRVPKWIDHQAKELGATINERAVAMLHEAVGNDLPALCAELDKLVSYAGGGEIGEEAVSAIVGVRRGETLGDLLDAVLERDAARALMLLPHVLEQPKTNAVTITMALGTQTLAVAWARALRDRGTPMGQMYNELFNLLKESGGAFTGRSWGDAVKSWTRGVERWTTPQLDRALALLLATDYALKESRVSSEEQVLTTLVLSLCGLAEQARGARGAAA
ncbi:MAG TPA: DNA polymerase III subunit delta, partial [Gemmatimonadaceae bacterium]|nr:DNA polymerase III subunit delta [Gemmatimonadaceae bacterium]